jgi:HPt (histidine-containing phosphotransfer) domain-containing protein
MSKHLVDVEDDADAASVLFAGEEMCDAVDMAALNCLEEMRAEGEPDLIVELVELYLESAPRQLAALLSAAAEGDEASLKCAAHSLKGSSASLGAFGVASLCEEIEVADCDSSQKVGALASRLEREFERACSSFASERRRRLRGAWIMRAGD